VELTGAPTLNDNKGLATPPCSTRTWHKLALPVGHPTGNNDPNCAHFCTFVLIFAHSPTVELPHTLRVRPCFFLAGGETWTLNKFFNKQESQLLAAEVHASYSTSRSTLIRASVCSVFFAITSLTFMQKITRLKRALDPSVLRWDRWCIPPLPAPLHPSSCISSAPRDSIELEHTSRHNAQHKKAGQIIHSLYM
jgi:hypothetical protein